MNITLILATAVHAVAPVVLLILLGYLLRQSGFLSGDFVKTGNRLVFNVCLPCMLFINVYNIESFAAINWPFVLYCAAIILLIFALGFITAVLLTKRPERRGVIWQCSFRSNFAIIGLSLAGALGGDEAEAVAAIVSSFAVPLLNILSVVSLSVFAKEGERKSDFGGILKNIAKNPLIISVVLGLVCVCIRELQVAKLGAAVFTLKEQCKFLYTAVNNLKSVASPFALLVLGGQFTFSAVKGLLKEITAGTLWRIVLAPLIGIGGAVLLGGMGVLSCGANEYPALIAMFGSPAAVSSAVMASSMGADEQLATQLVVWSSLFSVITVFAEVCILMAAGLLPV